MKTLRLSILAVLLVCSLNVFSNNKPSSESETSTNSKQAFLQSVEQNLIEHYVLQEMYNGTSEVLIIQCKVDELNKIKVVHIKGGAGKLNRLVTSIMENYPVEASSELKGQVIAFKLLLEAK